MKRSIAIACAVLAAAGCCKRQSCDRGAAPVSVAALAAAPATYADRTVAVTGILGNAGGNYFTDLRVVLTDSTGTALSVQPWLPTSVPPPRPGGPRPRPAVLSDYLGKTVKLTGCLRRDGDALSFEVQQAEIVMEENKQ
ncbi:MAG: hypothetical protein MUF78_06410 [Candidatus Edwardsbacteria bacterium]|jgi:hypothetical protein|nr:hypothetical protein [Candidatus Edwardsbacteria bacterium]